MTIPYTSTTYEHQGLERCDNPGLGKHLGVNIRSQAEVQLHSTMYIGRYQECISIPYFMNKCSTTQPPYDGSHREAQNGCDGLGALAATLYT
jgi:hypothetical protein